MYFSVNMSETYKYILKQLHIQLILQIDYFFYWKSQLKKRISYRKKVQRGKGETVRLNSTLTLLVVIIDGIKSHIKKALKKTIKRKHKKALNTT